jgi:hypothetical protein
MRGLVSFDALIALMLLTFVIVWLQDFAAAGLGGADSIGGSIQLKAAATSAGSEMNAFYVLSPKGDDYLRMRGGTLRFFSGNTAGITLAKNSDEAVVRASAGTAYYTYPVVGQLSYDSATGEYGP